MDPSLKSTLLLQLQSNASAQAAASAAATAALTHFAHQAEPATFAVDPARAVTINTSQVKPGQSFTLRVIGTTSGFVVGGVKHGAIDPQRVGVTHDRRALDIGVTVGQGHVEVMGLDSILAGAPLAEASGRCKLSRAVSLAASVEHATVEDVPADQRIHF